MTSLNEDLATRIKTLARVPVRADEPQEVA
jgi:hypothetical protein